MLELINSLNFYINGSSDSDNESVDMFISSGTNSDIVSDLDCYINCEIEPVNNGMNLYLESVTSDYANNSLNLYLESFDNFGEGVNFVLGSPVGFIWNELLGEWEDENNTWDYSPTINQLDSSLSLFLKSNWFDIFSNSMNMYMQRNEAEFLSFIIQSDGEVITSQIPIFIDSNVLSSDSVNLVINSVGVNSNNAQLYTHGF